MEMRGAMKARDCYFNSARSRNAELRPLVASISSELKG